MKPSNDTFNLQRVVDKRRLLTVSSKDRIRTVACKMPDYHVSAAGVLDDKGRFIGLITERDIVRGAVGVRKNVDTTLVEEIMCTKPIFVTKSATVTDALKTMTLHGIRCLPVVEGEKLIGIIDIRDLYEDVRILMQKALDDKETLICYYYGENYGGVTNTRKLFGDR